MVKSNDFRKKKYYYSKYSKPLNHFPYSIIAWRLYKMDRSESTIFAIRIFYIYISDLAKTIQMYIPINYSWKEERVLNGLVTAFILIIIIFVL